MKRHVLSAFMLSICFAACTPSKQSNLLTYSLEDVSAIHPNEEYPLDSLVNGMEVIPLETNDSCLIDGVGMIRETKDFYLIYSPKKAVLYKFDKEGKYIGKIGNKGQGPAEYIEVKQMETDNERSELYAMDYFGRKMNIYNFDGDFLRSFPLPKDFSYTRFYLLPQTQEVYYVSSNNAIQPDVLKYDTSTGESISLSYRDREMEKGEFFLGETFFTQKDTALYMYHYYNDTVFQIKKNQLLPSHLVKLGDRIVPWEDFGPDALQNPKPQILKIQVNGMESIKDKICIFYTVTRFEGNSSKRFMAMYSPGKEGTLLHANLTSNRFLPIKDAASFTSGYRHESILRTLTPESLEKDFCDKYGIKPEDNPVIIKYILK